MGARLDVGAMSAVGARPMGLLPAPRMLLLAAPVGVAGVVGTPRNSTEVKTGAARLATPRTEVNRVFVIGPNGTEVLYGKTVLQREDRVFVVDQNGQTEVKTRIAWLATLGTFDSYFLKPTEGLGPNLKTFLAGLGGPAAEKKWSLPPEPFKIFPSGKIMEQPGHFFDTGKLGATVADPARAAAVRRLAEESLRHPSLHRLGVGVNPLHIKLPPMIKPPQIRNIPPRPANQPENLRYDKGKS